MINKPGKRSACSVLFLFFLPFPFLHTLPLTTYLERAVLQECLHLLGRVELEFSLAHIRQRAVGRGGVRLAVYRQTEGAYPVNVHGMAFRQETTIVSLMAVTASCAQPLGTP